MDHLGDDELLALTARRPEAFAVFYRRHERMVLGYLMRRVGDAELAADLAAETFAAGLIGVRRFDPARGPATAWTWGSRATSFDARFRSGAWRTARGAAWGCRQSLWKRRP